MWILFALGCAPCSPCDTMEGLRRSEVDEEGRESGLERWTRTYTCDGWGRVETMTEYEWAGDRTWWWTVWTYDRHGRVVSREWFERNDGILSGLWTYTYDDEGRLVEADDGDSDAQIAYIYDDADCLVRREFYRRDELWRLETSACDAEARVIAIDESWSGDGQVDERIEYSYDDRDRVIQEWHASPWSTTLADYTWDDKDRLRTEHWVEDDGDLVEVSDFSWEYEANCVD